MATLIEARKGDGTLIGRCDASCYDATGPDCQCICGGRNHGKGFQKAVEQTKEELSKDRRDGYFVSFPKVQLSLFGKEKG